MLVLQEQQTSVECRVTEYMNEQMMTRVILKNTATLHALGEKIERQREAKLVELQWTLRVAARLKQITTLPDLETLS